MSAFTLKYGVATDLVTPGSTHVRIPIRKAGSGDFATSSDWTPATGDVKVVKDGGAAANITTLPTYANGRWQFALSAAELTAKQVEINVVDSATKAVDDAGFNVATFGHASAMYPPDHSNAASLGLANLDAQSSLIKSKTDLIPASPAAVGSEMTLANNAITDAKIAANAFTAAKFAAGAFDAVWTVAVRTLSAFGFGVTVTTNNDKLGYGLSIEEREATATVVDARLLSVGDATDLIAGIVSRIDNTNINEAALVAAFRADFERVGGMLALTAGDLATLLARATELRLAKLDVTGTLAHTDNANTFKADVSGVATQLSLDAVLSAAEAAAASADSADDKLTVNRMSTIDSLFTMIAAGKFTVAALENAPSGGGGSGGLTTAQDAKLTNVDDITTKLRDGAISVKVIQ